MASKSKNFTLGALIAASMGYLAGILTAPKSGRATRKDIAKNASKAKTQGEKQLKKLYKELDVQIKAGEKKIKNAKTSADAELKKAVDSAKKSQRKAKLLLSALHEGDAEDPDLKAIINETKKARADLKKFLKK
jgi:gas vesicle protein